MSKRITLTDEDIDILVKLIKDNLTGIKPYNIKELVTLQARERLLGKFELAERELDL